MTVSDSPLPSSPPEPDLQAAARSLAEGRPAEAADRLAALVASAPTYAAAHVLHATALEAAGRAADALDAWNYAAFLVPTSPLVRRERQRLLAAPAPTPEPDVPQQAAPEEPSATGTEAEQVGMEAIRAEVAEPQVVEPEGVEPEATGAEPAEPEAVGREAAEFDAAELDRAVPDAEPALQGLEEAPESLEDDGSTPPALPDEPAAAPPAPDEGAGLRTVPLDEFTFLDPEALEASPPGMAPETFGPGEVPDLSLDPISPSAESRPEPPPSPLAADWADTEPETLDLLPPEDTASFAPAPPPDEDETGWTLLAEEEGPGVAAPQDAELVGPESAGAPPARPPDPPDAPSEEAAETPPSGTYTVADELDALIARLDGARITPDPSFVAPTVTREESGIDEMASETLAQIYAAQHQYVQAAVMYEKLAAQKPDRADELLERAAEMRGKR